MARKTNEEQLIEVTAKLEQLQNKKASLEKKIKERQRKDRTKRLIEKGALSEKYFNCEDMSTEDFEILVKKIANFEQVRSFLANTNNSTSNITISKK